MKLFINDYNTELPTKRADYLELISALVARGVPVDGVGHQAHVDFARPVSWLRDSIRAVERIDTRLLQAITELDVNASNQNEGADVSGAPQDPYTPVYADDAQAAAEVGYYYRDLFQMIRQQAASIDSVTFWGVGHARSWLRTWPIARPWEQPLPFDDDLQAAPAYWGIVDPTRLPTRPADPSADATRGPVSAAHRGHGRHHRGGDEGRGRARPVRAAVGDRHARRERARGVRAAPQGDLPRRHHDGHLHREGPRRQRPDERLRRDRHPRRLVID